MWFVSYYFIQFCVVRGGEYFYSWVKFYFLISGNGENVSLEVEVWNG